jgi:cytochrome c-type biogenesis protein CcsB
MRRACSLTLAVLLLPLSAAAADWPALRRLAVQDGGRTKPLDTFAREAARRVGGARVFGAESIAGLEPTEWLLAMMAAPEQWKEVTMVRVTQADLRASLDLPAARDRFSFRELVSSDKLMEALRALEARTAAAPDAKLEPAEEALSTLYGTLNLLAGIFSMDAVKMVPPQGPRHEAWLALSEVSDPAAAARLRVRADALLSAYAAGDLATADAAARALGGRLRQIAPDAYPGVDILDREVLYNRVKPFRLAWLLYLVGAALVLGAMTSGSRAYWALLPIGLGWILHTYGLAVRSAISGRAPVTNMYETVVFAAWGAVLFALLFEGRRPAQAVVAAALLAVGCVVIADSVPIMDGAIHPLVPVLRDNFWLTTHVLTITLGYAAFLLAAGLAHWSLFVWFASPARSQASAVPRLLYRALQAGTLLLAAGTLLGGIWASYSWGRFWGWDPKETWALIALLGYLSLLHARSAGIVREFGLAVGSIVAFLGVLMAWYGVNFVLGTGLHSYGFGAGGYGYAAGFAGLEVGLAAFALLVWQRRHGVHAPAANAAAAHS